MRQWRPEFIGAEIGCAPAKTIRHIRQFDSGINGVRVFVQSPIHRIYGDNARWIGEIRHRSIDEHILVDKSAVTILSRRP